MTWVYLDGAFVTAEEARVAAGDTAVLFGHGLFETFRARRGAVYLLDRHLARLRAGAETLGIEPPASLAGLAAIVRELSERCGFEEARVRLTLTAGAEGGRPALLIQARPALDYPEHLYEQGIAAVVASVRRNETSPLSRVKSLNYLDNLLARQQARNAGADEAILLNTRGLVAEGSASNLFIVRGTELVTPPIEDGALPGVTRGAVLALAAAAGLRPVEASLTLDDLRNAEEAFLTNAIAGVLPLVAIDGAAIGAGAPGEGTQRLRALYENAVSETRTPPANPA